VNKRNSEVSYSKPLFCYGDPVERAWRAKNADDYSLTQRNTTQLFPISKPWRSSSAPPKPVTGVFKSQLALMRQSLENDPRQDGTEQTPVPVKVILNLKQL